MTARCDLYMGAWKFHICVQKPPDFWFYIYADRP